MFDFASREPSRMSSPRCTCGGGERGSSLCESPRPDKFLRLSSDSRTTTGLSGFRLFENLEVGLVSAWKNLARVRQKEGIDLLFQGSSDHFSGMSCES